MGSVASSAKAARVTMIVLPAQNSRMDDSSIDHESMAGHEGGHRADQIEDAQSDFLGLAESAQRGPLQIFCLEGGIAVHPAAHPGVDVARRDGVHPHPQRPELDVEPLQCVAGGCGMEGPPPPLLGRR